MSFGRQAARRLSKRVVRPDTRSLHSSNAAGLPAHKTARPVRLRTSITSNAASPAVWTSTEAWLSSWNAPTGTARPKDHAPVPKSAPTALFGALPATAAHRWTGLLRQTSAAAPTAADLGRQPADGNATDPTVFSVGRTASSGVNAATAAYGTTCSSAIARSGGQSGAAVGKLDGRNGRTRRRRKARGVSAGAIAGHVECVSRGLG